MCLFSKQILPRRATKDITCYKVVERRRTIDGQYELVTPFQRMEVRIGETFKADGPVKGHIVSYRLIPLEHRTMNSDIISVVEDGYIHCFTNERDACSFKYESTRSIIIRDLRIIRCVIPKGTLYYKSYNGKTICARRIKLIQML